MSRLINEHTLQNQHTTVYRHTDRLFPSLWSRGSKTRITRRHADSLSNTTGLSSRDNEWRNANCDAGGGVACRSAYVASRLARDVADRSTESNRAEGENDEEKEQVTKHFR